MGKSAKKRTKKYTGAGAKNASNVITVHKVNAVARNDFMQWIHDHRKLLKRSSIVIVIIGIIAFLVIEAILAMS